MAAPEPASQRNTLIDSSSAPGATPRTMPATSVPWPEREARSSRSTGGDVASSQSTTAQPATPGAQLPCAGAVVGPVPDGRVEDGHRRARAVDPARLERDRAHERERGGQLGLALAV